MRERLEKSGRLKTENWLVRSELSSGQRIFILELANDSLFVFDIVLKVNTKKHLEDLVKDWDSWKNKCIQVWKGVAPVLDLISPKLPEDQPRAQNLGLIEKAQRAWGWLQQFVKDAGEYARAHVLSMVRAHYPLVDLSRLERGYPKEVDPKEADDLHVGLLDLSSIVVSDINLCGTSAPPNQPGSDMSIREWSESSTVVDG